MLTHDTAALKPAGEFLKLRRRCVRCDAEFNSHCQLKKYGLLAKDDLQVCSDKSCARACFCGSRLCKAHLYEFQSENEYVNVNQEELECRLKPAMELTWKAQPEMEHVLHLFNSIRDGRMEPSRLSFLDLEFNCSTRKVFEIGMCDAKGAVTMDCLVKDGPMSNVRASTVFKSAFMDRVIENSVKRHRYIHG